MTALDTLVTSNLPLDSEPVHSKHLEIACAHRFGLFAFSMQIQFYLSNHKVSNDVISPFFKSLAQEAMRELVAVMIWLPDAYTNCDIAEGQNNGL